MNETRNGVGSGNGAGSRGRVFGLSPRAARWALGVSLAANCLVLGLAGGAAWHAQDQHHHGGSFRFSHAIVDATGEDRKDRVREIMDAARNDKTRDEARSRWSLVADAVEARPYTPEGLMTAFSQVSAAYATEREQRNAHTAQAIALLTDDERAALAQQMREHMERRKKDRD